MKTLSVGIGCRLQSSADDIEAAVRATLGVHRIEQIRDVGTIDSKADAQGLRAFCARHALPLRLFSREQIAAMPVVNPSAAAREHVGVDGVCEPCALLAASLGAAAAGPSAAFVAPAAAMQASVAAAELSPAAQAKGAAAAPSVAMSRSSAGTARLVVPKTRHAGVTVAIATCASDASA